MIFMIGCTVRGPTTVTDEEPAATPELAPQVESPAIIEPVETPKQPTAVIRQPTTKEGASERPVPYDKTAEWDMVTLDSYKLKRISRDKGEVAEVTFTVRNPSSKAITPELILWFHAQETEDESITDVTEKKYDLPKLEPGYKVTKTYPVTMRFHFLDQEKKFTLMLREKFVSPPKELYRTEKAFIPIDEMENMGISWT